MTPFSPKNSYSYEELIECAKGNLFGAGNAQLPLPNMLMIDRIVSITADGGNPVMPGCLGLDAMWQLVGFFLGWSGGKGRGRALGCGEVKFVDQVLPSNKKVTYRIDMKRVIMRKLVLGIADATLSVDGKEIYQGTDLRVGLFTNEEQQP